MVFEGSRNLSPGAQQAAEKGNAVALVRREIPQGLKPELFFQSFTARLKPCPYYKAAERGSQDEFFRSLSSPPILRFVAARINPCPFKAPVVLDSDSKCDCPAA
jgi:hypothetical protein